MDDSTKIACGSKPDAIDMMAELSPRKDPTL
jgi:hypothetical protein